jgi:AAA family ATPase
VDIIQLEDCSDPDKLVNYGTLCAADKVHWEWGLEYHLSKCEVLSVGLIFDAEMKGQRRSFKVTGISAQSATEKTIFRFTKTSTIKISEDTEKVARIANLQVRGSGLGGLCDQISRLNESLFDFNSQAHAVMMPSFYSLNRGVLIYGPKGTGKTSLLQRVEAAGWEKSFVIGSSTLSRSVGDGEAKLRKIFHDALLSQPSVIVIDQLEFVAPKRTSHESSSLAYALCESIDALANAKVLVVAATRHPNDVDDSLRTPHRLAIEIELSVPTASARAQILRAIRGVSTEPDDSILDMMAEKTHGYVGADLFALLQLSCRKARMRQRVIDVPLGMAETSSATTSQGHESTVSLAISEADVIEAMQEVRPTAMREVFLETPKVRWSDIGGQYSIKRHLQKVVERPLRVWYPAHLSRLNVSNNQCISIPNACEGSMSTAGRGSYFMGLLVVPKH